MITLLIQGETPSKKNAKKFNSKSKTVYTTKHYQKWYNNAFAQVMEQKKNISLINKPSKIKITFVHADLVRRDSDNGTSSILDLLQDCGILADDNWQIVRELNIRNGYLKGKAYCKVEIEAL